MIVDHDEERTVFIGKDFRQLLNVLMARQLGRHRSTIYRGITRNTFRDRELSDYGGPAAPFLSTILTVQR